MDEPSHDDLVVDQCPECGEPLEPEAATCSACGVALFEDAAPHVEFQDVEDVHTCTMSQGLALRASLVAKGYRVFVADEQTKTIDPFVIGGNAWAVTLRAPVEQAAAVREEIRLGELAREDREGRDGEETPRRSRALWVIAIVSILMIVWTWYTLTA